MDMQGPDFSNCKDQMFPDFRDPMKIFSESRDPIFNSRDANRVPKTLKKLVSAHSFGNDWAS